MGEVRFLVIAASPAWGGRETTSSHDISVTHAVDVAVLEVCYLSPLLQRKDIQHFNHNPHYYVHHTSIGRIAVYDWRRLKKFSMWSTRAP